MDLMALLRVLGRRWYLTLALFSVSLFAVYAVVGTGPADYKASTSMVVLGPNAKPKTLTEPGGLSNPWQDLGSNQSIMATTLSTIIASDQFAAAVRAHGVAGSWTAVDPTGGPILNLSATGKTGPEAMKAVGVVLEEARNSLRTIQTEALAPSSQLMTLQSFNSTGKGVPQYGHTLKVGVAMGAVLIGISIAIVFGFDTLLTSRSRRKASRKASRKTSRKTTGDDADDTENAGTSPGRETASASFSERSSAELTQLGAERGSGELSQLGSARRDR